MSLTAKSANVSESGVPVRIYIRRWSTDAERSPIVATLDPNRQPAAAPPAVTPPPPAPPPAADPAPDPDDAQQAGGGGRGGAGGGRGGGRGGATGRGGGRGDAAAPPPPPPPPPTPIERFAAALTNAPTLGYIWTNEVTGYAIKYAHRSSLPGGGERIILASDRRLGVYNGAWKPTSATASGDYKFTVIELRVDPKGAGEGKTSLTTRVVLENGNKDIALDNYTVAPVTLQSVQR